MAVLMIRTMRTDEAYGRVEGKRRPTTTNCQVIIRRAMAAAAAANQLPPQLIEAMCSC